MRRVLRCAALLALALTSSCAVVRHTVTPLDVDFDETPVAPDVAKGHRTRVSIRVDVEFGRNGIGELAKRAGMETVDYADLEVYRIFAWTQTILHIYGRNASGEPVQATIERED